MFKTIGGTVLVALGYIGMYLSSLIGTMWAFFETLALYNSGATTMVLVLSGAGWLVGATIFTFLFGAIIFYAGSVLAGAPNKKEKV